VRFDAKTLCVASQRVFIVVVYLIMTQSGNFWIHRHMFSNGEHSMWPKRALVILLPESGSVLELLE